ncbi:MAG: SNF2-related protein, partial [Actinomycetota bacterium]
MPFAGELRPFQADAVDRLLDWGGSGLLAIIMGGGKTPTAIALIEQLLDDEEVEAGLVITPPGIKRQWVKALNQFAPGSHVALIDGTPKQREAQYAAAMDWAEYIIFGYNQLLDDWAWVRKLPRDFIIADEVQAIKNFKAKRTKKLKKLGGGIRVGLTGQPMENRPEDVFSIGEWIDPEVLGNFNVFDRTFVVRNSWGRPVRYKNLPLLRSTL